MDIKRLTSHLNEAIDYVISLHNELINAVKNSKNEAVKNLIEYKIDHYYDDVDYEDILNELKRAVADVEDCFRG